MARLGPALALALVILPALPAGAEAPLGDACTPDVKCPDGLLCPYAFDPDEPDGEWQALGADCRELALQAGMQWRCRDGDDLAGDALYCPPDDAGLLGPDDLTDAPDPVGAPKPPKPPKPKAKGCAVHGDADGTGLLALAALLLARLRRRRTT